VLWQREKGAPYERLDDEDARALEAAVGHRVI